MLNKITVTIIASALLSNVAFAQDFPDANPGSVFRLPEGYSSDTSVAGTDVEYDGDLDIFLSRGYEEIDWIANTALVQKVYEEIALPDYEKRSGKSWSEPWTYRVEIANPMITKQGFKDLVVSSGAPGDCDEAGCLFQIYTLLGETWTKRLEFKASAIALKHDGNMTKIAAVGGESHPSRIIEWDGQQFSE